MPATDASSTPQPVWWKRRPLRFSFAAFGAVLVILWGARLYYSGLRASTVNLELSSGAKFLAETEGAVRVKLADTRKNAPLANVPVEIELVDPASNRVEKLAGFSTDASGSGPAGFRLPAWNDGGYTLRVTAKPDSGPEVIERGIRLERSIKVMLSTDKPLYQPGQTIHLRALALRRPDLKPVAEEAATVTVVDPKGNVVYKQTPKTSKFGIVSADFQLADEVIEGSYALSVVLRGVESKLDVEVKPYVLPKFKVEITTDKPYYRPGETVKGKVKASYFFGKPVQGEVAVDSNPRVAQQTLKTDQKGEATFDAVLMPNRFSQNPMRPDRVAFTVQVTDAAGQQNSRTVSRNVVGQDLLIEAIPENGAIVAGVPNRIYVLVSKPDGEPTKASVRIGEKTLQTDGLGVAVWEATPEGGVLSPNVTATAENRTASRSFTFAVGTSNRDFLMRADRSVYAAGEPMKLTFQAGTSEPIFVDLLQGGQVIRTATVEIQQGKGELLLDLPPEWVGALDVNAYRLEVTGQVIGKRRSIFVRPAKDLTIRASFESLTPPAKQLLTGGAGAPATFRPGEQARVTLSLLDADGKPAPGAISLAAVDEAVFHILEERPGLEKQFFLHDPSSADLPPIDELVAPPGEAKEADRTVREEARFARAAGPLTYVAANANKRETYPEKVRQTEERRRSGLAWVSRGWRFVGYFVGLVVTVLALFGIQRVAANFVESPTTAWQIAVPSLLMILAMIVIVINSPEYFRSDRTASKGVEIFDGAGAPMAARKEERAKGSEAPEGGEGVYVRRAFPETLLWKPELVTDDSGKAVVEFPLADSITSWRMTASGVNANGQLGGWQSELIVFQPFFIDLNLPVRLTRGDEISAPVVVSNYRKEAQKVKVTLKKADWFEQLDGDSREIDLAPNEVKSVHYRIRASKVGRQTFEVLGTSGHVADAVQRVVEVVPNGRRVEQVMNGTLDQPAAYSLSLPDEAVEGSAKLFVRFYPSSFSQLVEGMDSIFQMPSGCFEQTSSTTYPNVLALDYLKRMKQSSPLVEARARQYINAGYQRLLTFEVPGGGFDWYGHAPAKRTLTAYGLMEFRDMAEVHSVDPKLIARTRDWLLRQRKDDGSWEPDGWNPGHRHVAAEGKIDLPRVMATAYVAWAVFPGDRTDAGRTKDFLGKVNVEDVTDPYVLALLANALLAVEDIAGANGAFTRLDKLKQQTKEGDQVWWSRKPEERTALFGAGQSGDIETTALVVLAKKQAKLGAASVKPSLLWLTKQRDPRGTWHTTQATVLTLKALLSGSQPGGEAVERKIDIALGTTFKKQVVVPADQVDVVQQIDLSGDLVTGTQALNVSESTPGETNFQVAFRYHVTAGEGKDFGPFPVMLQFDREKVRVGDSIHATLRTVNSNPRQDAPMVLMELPVPVGFAANPAEFTKLVAEKKIERFQSRADRVIIYLRGMKALDVFDLKYSLRAVQPVKVTANGAKVYEYYDPAKVGVSPVSTLEVTE